MTEMKSILFVCLGNICRSPAAEGICKNIAKNLICDSAGTGAWHVGESPDSRSQKVCLKNGIDISNHKGRQIQKNDWKKYNVIAALDPDIFSNLQRSKPSDAISKLVLFNFPDGIEDPYYGGQSGFDTMFEQLSNLMPKFLKDNDLL